MAVPRAIQFIALRNLARGSHQVRQLHMTGPATYASPTLLKERPAMNLPRDIVALRAMCKQRGLDISGPKGALIARIEANELAHSRAFSTAIKQSERPAIDIDNSGSKQPTPYGTFEFSKPVRHFNTSRELKANNDSSTIDFAYLPSEILRPADVHVHSQIRVPIIPTLDASSSRQDMELEDVVVMKPQINTVSADAVYLPFAEASDGHAMDVDFHAMTDRITANFQKIKGPVDEQAGIVKQIFSGMMDDIMGLKKLGTA